MRATVPGVMSLHFNRLGNAVCYPQETVECLDDNAASEFVSGSMSAAALTKVEGHLAGCRDCRALVAALAGGPDDSNADTRKHEKVSEDSQVAKRPTLSVGDRVGRYLVLSTLGAGGMGVVFSAYDPQLDRKVALKLLRANLRGPSAKEARTRLKREAQAIAQLNHPNVVGVYDVGTTDDGDVYIAMEFVEGDTLTSWLKKWPRSWREILEVFHQASRGLMAAHTVGLLHRDFKPDNVLVGGDGRVRVTDFGLARSVLGPDEGARPTSPATPLHADLTATGTVLGTPRYMPPEQLTGPEIDARADQFSFCVALYEALYGTHPLQGATSVAMLETGARAALPPEGTRVPTSIGRAVMRGLEKDRAKRFPTMAALMHELTPPPQRSPVRFAAVAAVGLILVGGATAAVVTRPSPTSQQPYVDGTLEKLVSEINKRDAEIKELRRQLTEGQVKHAQDIEQLKTQLDQKQQEVQQLVDQVAQLRLQMVQGRPPARPPQDPQIIAAIQGALGNVEGCFKEWDDRALAFGSAKAVLFTDADLVVEFSVAPDGHAYNQRARGVDSPSLTLCVADALASLQYPHGPDHSDLQVQVAWAAGNIKMTGRIVSHRAPSSSTLEGI
jgi:serine/threonine protein kinase